MNSKLSSVISNLNAVAMGDATADMILQNCSLVNVYTREVSPNTDIAITQGRIAYVGEDASHTRGSKTVVMDVNGKYVSPGFADPHVHIDQFVLPSEFAKKSLLNGVTSLFSDPIDIVSVCGYRGFKQFLNFCSNLPIRIFNVVPGGLPVDRKFSHGKTLSESQTKAAVKLANVLGLGEVFSWTKVTSRDSKTMRTLSMMLENDCIINGHTAGASNKKLNAYVSSGILSCHEPINFDQVIERLRLGMWIMIREGSIRRDLQEIIPGVLSHGTFTDRLMFCSDGLDPHDIQKYGHINYCVRESIKLGVEPIEAIAMASKNCFDYYSMGHDLGGIAPGKLADILVLNDLEKLDINKVFVGGKLVASNGSIVSTIKKQTIPKWIKHTVKLQKLSDKDFEVRCKAQTANVNIIQMKTEIITEQGGAELPVRSENVLPSADKDVWKVAAFDRTGNTKKKTIGFLSNFGADIGALASTWSFHENDLLVIGSNEKDMAVAANHLIKNQGGMAVSKQGRIHAFLPLQIAGIISNESFDKVSNDFSSLNSVMVDSGSKFEKPHLIPLFLSFLALPDIRILYGGIVNVKKRSLVPVFAK